MVCGMTYYEIGEYFLVYSFFGWCLEVVYHAVKHGHVVNRGFLNGPICPIYGFGMIGIMMFLNTLQGTLPPSGHSLLVLFAAGMVICTAVELFGGWALDKLFHARWWDYSKEPYNFRGYICLRFSLIWGAAVVAAVRLIHPVVSSLSGRYLPEEIGWYLMAGMYLLAAADLLVTVLVVLGLNRRIKEIDRLRADMRIVSDDLTMRLADSAMTTQRRVNEAQVQAKLGRMQLEQNLSDARKEYRQDRAEMKREAERRLEELRARISGHFSVERRLFRAFPDLQLQEGRDVSDAVKTYLQNTFERKK